MSESQKHVADVRAVFDDWAKIGRGDTMGEGHKVNARPAFERLDLKPNQRYLDIGCGVGYSVRWAADVDQSVEAIGIDVAPEMIERARILSASYKNARFEISEFPAELPGDEGIFDAIFSMEALYYLPDLDAGLRAISALLKTGGKVVSMVDFYAENEASHHWPQDLGVSMTLLSAQGWQEAFEAAGLKVIEQTRIRDVASKGLENDWKYSQGSLLTLAVKA